MKSEQLRTDAYSVKEDVDILEHISQDLTGNIIYFDGADCK